MRIALAQMNATVGALAGNVERIRAFYEEACEGGAQIVVFPELALCGYPPEDLLLREDFLEACETALFELAKETTESILIVGAPEWSEEGCFNTLAVLQSGALVARYRKMHLPNYGVFDEKRYFAAGDGGAVVRVDGRVVGLSVCEDVWLPGDPLRSEALAGAELVLNISASPYHREKGKLREAMIAQRARDNVCAIAYCNLVGGQDELVFDGHSFVVDHRGHLVARARQFEEEILFVDLELGSRSARLHDTRSRRIDPRAVATLADLTMGTEPTPTANAVHVPLDEIEEVYRALVLGVRDYVEKNGFPGVILGLSGGIDSALVALIAADAVGADRVTAMVMPSRFSSDETQSDARALAESLGLRLVEVGIETMTNAFEVALEAEFAGLARDVTEENVQARVRGTLLMALSNKLGPLLLSTGNKSEMSVGYATLYGDMAGGFAVLKDVPKTLVFDLVRWRGAEVVPETIVSRPPSAELAEDQQDTDSLPPYEILDPIIERYVELDESLETIVKAGYERSTVERVLALIDRAEYKRRQAPPGIKITPRAFGRDRRMPITSHAALLRRS